MAIIGNDDDMNDEIFLRGIDAGDFQSSVVEGVVQAVKPLLREMNEPRLVDGDRMAELAAISRPTLDRAVKDGNIPCVRIGRCVRFEPRKVIDALSKASQQ